MMKHLLFLTVLIVSTVRSESFFVTTCKDLPPSSTVKSSLNENNCYEIENTIKTLKSFSEVIAPEYKVVKKEKDILSYPWTDDFPHLYGISKKLLQNKNFSRSTYYFNPIQSLDIFKDFKNLTDITYTPDYFYYKGARGLCQILKSYPFIKTITLEQAILKNPISKSCLEKSSIEGIIIRGKSNGDIKKLFNSRIVGLEYYVGNLEDLAELHKLRYLGISNSANTMSGVEALFGLPGLTHLSINISGQVNDFSKLQSLKNLSYLSVTCTNSESNNLPYQKGCEKSTNLSNINFVKKLTWLRYLNLNFNKIDDISILKNAKHLEVLKLRGNEISKVDLSGLVKLRYLDLSGNKLQEESEIKLNSNLQFLNLSGNKLSNFTMLKQLKQIEYLNLSNNEGFDIDPDMTLASLKVLNINGNGGNPQINYFRHPDWNDGLKMEEMHLFEALFNDYAMSPLDTYRNQCKVMPMYKNRISFSSFPNLEFLSLNNNSINDNINLTDLKKLKFISYQMNTISKLEPGLLPISIETLILDNNEITNFPQISGLTKLKKLSLNSNNIQDIVNVEEQSALQELNLGNNLIEDVTPLKNYFNKNDQTNNLQILGNPIHRSLENCPIDGENDMIGDLCLDYVYNNKGYIKQSLELVNTKDFSSWHNKRKCSITSLAL